MCIHIYIIYCDLDFNNISCLNKLPVKHHRCLQTYRILAVVCSHHALNNIINSAANII